MQVNKVSTRRQAQAVGKAVGYHIFHRGTDRPEPEEWRSALKTGGLAGRWLAVAAGAAARSYDKETRLFTEGLHQVLSALASSTVGMMEEIQEQAQEQPR